MEKYSLSSLADVLAQLVHFVWDDYGPDDDPPELVQWAAAYQVACFAAQHTPQGKHGVETEEGLLGLKVKERMSYVDRLAVAKEFVRLLDY